MGYLYALEMGYICRLCHMYVFATRRGSHVGYQRVVYLLDYIVGPNIFYSQGRAMYLPSIGLLQPLFTIERYPPLLHAHHGMANKGRHPQMFVQVQSPFLALQNSRKLYVAHDKTDSIVWQTWTEPIG